jgi:hypothetical protein
MIITKILISSSKSALQCRVVGLAMSYAYACVRNRSLNCSVGGGVTRPRVVNLLAGPRISRRSNTNTGLCMHWSRVSRVRTTRLPVIPKSIYSRIAKTEDITFVLALGERRFR